MYLPLESNKRILTDIGNHVKKFRLSCDYMSDSVITKTTGDPGIVTLVEAFANMGAPWISGIADIRSLALELGLNVIENFRTGELYQSYWTGRPMTSPIFEFYSVCTLEAPFPRPTSYGSTPQSTATPQFTGVGVASGLRALPTRGEDPALRSPEVKERFDSSHIA
jgi:hypothetical protein